MATTPALLSAAALGLGGFVIFYVAHKVYAGFQRDAFIQNYAFRPSWLTELQKRHPNVSPAEQKQVIEALRLYFRVHLRVPNMQIGMPSKVVDDLWHIMILDTRAYSEFCKRAFGSYFHHTPAAEMRPGVSSDLALRRAWYQSCRLEMLNPKSPARLPLLFAIDTQLKIVGGHPYLLKKPTTNEVVAGSVGVTFGYGCSGDGLASDSPGADGCSGGGDSSCGGGGCGGGGD
jgi:hypothetical protein